MFKLTIEALPTTSTLVARHQWPVKITAKNIDDTAAKIFVYQEAPPGGHELDFFSCVASALQMYALPEDATGSDGPFYRVATMEVLCNTAESAVELCETVEDAVRDLADNIADAQTLTVQKQVTITPNV
jgi:hypothetical protein